MRTTMTDVAGPCSVLVQGTIAEDNLLRRIRGEFREMPGMRLTLDQAMRLWMLDRQECTGALDKLLATGFLGRDTHGRYRRSEGEY